MHKLLVLWGLSSALVFIFSAPARGTRIQPASSSRAGFSCALGEGTPLRSIPRCFAAAKGPLKGLCPLKHPQVGLSGLRNSFVSPLLNLHCGYRSILWTPPLKNGVLLRVPSKFLDRYRHCLYRIVVLFIKFERNNSSMRRIFTLSIICFLAASCSLYINPVVLESRDIIIPAEGGIFYFQMKYHVTTKTTQEELFRAWEYRVIVGENIINTVLVNSSWPLDSWIELEPDPDYSYQDGSLDHGPWGIPFDVPENNESESRPIKVEVLFAKDYQEYDSHVDPGDNTWTVAFDAIQEGSKQ